MNIQYVFHSYRKDKQGVILLCETIDQIGIGAVVCEVPVKNDEKEVAKFKPQSRIKVSIDKGQKTGTASPVKPK